MGEQQKKYHVTDDGVVYRVDDTGEVTEMGNVNSLSTSNPASTRPSNNASTSDIATPHGNLADLERMLCEGTGNALNRFERQIVAAQSNNIDALKKFVNVAGLQWLRIIIKRFEKGETNLEPILLEMSKSTFGPLFELASCKRAFSDRSIYTNLFNSDNSLVKDALKANSNSPYYESGRKMPSKKSDDGCLGCLGSVLLFIITSAILTYLVI